MIICTSALYWPHGTQNIIYDREQDCWRKKTFADSAAAPLAVCLLLLLAALAVLLWLGSL
ncbi:MAG: hypothetical protein EBS50_08730 [Sphingomonadaceae bacterium]|nr:hypothetical protein [Sphingomonadaceae bacterium]